jgi:hypothetical protein
MFTAIDVLIFISYRYILSSAFLVGAVVAAWYFLPDVHDYVSAKGVFDFCIEFVGYYLLISVAIAALKWVMFHVNISRKVKKLAQKGEEAS